MSGPSPLALGKRVFRKYLTKADLRQIRIHILRSTCATLRIQAGHNIADVSKKLGHHSIKVTVDTYYRWMPGSGRSQVNESDSETATIRNPAATSCDPANGKRASQ